MKKRIFLMLCLICVLAAGCSDGDAFKAEGNNIKAPEGSASETGNDSPERQQSAVSAGVGVDVDLTALSGVMVYAEVYKMMVSPDDYIGKIVKIRGPYYAAYYDVTDRYYHYVIIEDATACCQQGLAFVWDGDHTYPDDYPEENKEIEVVGVFGSYEELGNTYYYLAVNELSILE